MSELEDHMATRLRQMLPGVEWEAEHRFAAIHTGGTGKGVRARLKRAGLKDWRFDFADVERKIAIECDGGTWARGRHTRGAGFAGDARKRNAATSMGWRVYNFTSDMIYSDEAIRFIEGVYNG